MMSDICELCGGIDSYCKHCGTCGDCLGHEVVQWHKEITRLREDVERHKRLIETLSERIADDTSTLEKHQAVTKALAEWSQKYPKSRIMSAPTHAKCEYELAEIELMAIALQDQQT